MKKFAMIATALVVLGGVAHAQVPPTTTTTSTTAETPAGTVTTTTDVTTPPPPAPVPTARDAITGQTVDPSEVTPPQEPSLRDKIRAKIKDEATVKQ